jgi:hypothetical protein
MIKMNVICVFAHNHEANPFLSEQICLVARAVNESKNRARSRAAPNLPIVRRLSRIAATLRLARSSPSEAMTGLNMNS